MGHREVAIDVDVESDVVTIRIPAELIQAFSRENGQVHRKTIGSRGDVPTLSAGYPMHVVQVPLGTEGSTKIQVREDVYLLLLDANKRAFPR